MERKDIAPQRPRTQSWEPSECWKQPRGYQRPVHPGGTNTREVPFLPQLCEASRPLKRPQPPAAWLAPLGKEAVPAPPRAAPTSWRKNSFLKPEWRTCVPQLSMLMRVYADLKEQNNSTPKLQLMFVLLSNALIDKKLRRLNYPVRPLPTCSSLSPFLQKSQSDSPRTNVSWVSSFWMVLLDTTF